METTTPGSDGWTNGPPAASHSPGAEPDMLTLFRQCVERQSAAPALLYFDGSVSYAELDRSSDALALWLISGGVRAGDRIAIVLQNIPQFVMMTVAAWKMGAIPVPGNPMYRGPELARIFADAEPAAILCHDTHLAEAREALAIAGLGAIPILATSAYAFQTGEDARVLPARPARDEGTPLLEEVVAEHRGERPAAFRPRSDDLGLILYTSGTTGVPKGAMIRHSSLTFNADAFCSWCDIGPGSRILGVAPFFHITGFLCHLAAAMHAGAALVIHYRVEPSLVLDMIRVHRPTFTVGAITAFNALMNVPGLTADDMASFDRIYSGGAPIPPALRDAIGDAFGTAVYSCYGMTETTAPTHMAPFGRDIPVDPESGALAIGMAMSGTEAKIVRDDGETAPPGEAGELLIRGPQVMAGYWRKPEESAEALRQGWMHTGDVAFQDEEGWFYLVDRKKDVIIASGFKVWPREVEDILYAHPAVLEAAVVGVPDPYRGETVKGFVSLRKGSTAAPQDIIDHCRASLAAYKIPRTIEILAELPKTVTGKIQRVALR